MSKHLTNAGIHIVIRSKCSSKRSALNIYLVKMLSNKILQLTINNNYGVQIWPL